jgi:ubiquitin thioesterase protein OTUB1
MVDQVIAGMTEADLYTKFQDQGVADYLVVFLRILTSAELRKNAEFYSNFIEGEQSLEEFCQLEVEPMYKESDHIHIIALTTALAFGVRVVYMDRGMGGTHDFPDGSNPTVHLLYRPGHYDVIYAD